jgi:hypothetical protein
MHSNGVLSHIITNLKFLSFQLHKFKHRLHKFFPELCTCPVVIKTHYHLEVQKYNSVLCYGHSDNIAPEWVLQNKPHAVLLQVFLPHIECNRYWYETLK